MSQADRLLLFLIPSDFTHALIISLTMSPFHRFLVRSRISAYCKSLLFHPICNKPFIKAFYILPRRLCYTDLWTDRCIGWGWFSMRNTQDVIYDMLIIGGGAAGLMLAAGLTLPADYMPEDGSPSAGKSNCFRGLILEKTSRPGTKLLMTGGGRCNITHAGTMKELLSTP